ncbi:unnamed protein product, partial [Mesorhabditis belari]|uniref:Amyloid-beta-like protein n=1 Tax=Mesorhabditis belari TaxID=2138241 RepID=A0AAF3FI81_9BILA
MENVVSLSIYGHRYAVEDLKLTTKGGAEMGLWALLLVPLAAASHISEVAVNVDELSGKRHSSFVPLVSFKCGFRNKYMSDDGEWVSDANRYATCQTGKLDILKYCKRAYPTLNVTNIVEYSHEVTVEKWCKEEGSPCKWSHTVRPYRCIVGEFHSEALQVPKGCKFSHVNGRDQCNDYNHWKDVSMQQCNAKGTTMNVRSFAMLEPCGLDLFTGVEFVCCPSNGEPLIEVKPVTQKAAVKKEEYDDEYDDDDDSVSLESDEDDDETKKEQDPYFKTIDPTNEHENFKKAAERLEKKHRDKINKVMKEWSELEGRYKKMTQKDSKGAEAFKAEMTNRFQKTVASLEEENKQAKQEIEKVHEERVQEALNEKKRQATHDYRQALALHVGSANKHNVLKTLKSYIRSEEKDRIHMLNRYRHLMRTDIVEAKKSKPELLHRLRYIDLRINGTLAMLRDFPDLESQVRPIALAFWSDLRKENTPEITDEEINKLNSLSNEAQIENEKEIKVATTTEASKKIEKTKVLPDDTRDSEEDDDEYYEDEDDEEVRKIKKVPIKAEQQKVELKPKPISVEVEELKKELPKKDEGVQTDKEDEDEDSDESDSDEDDDKDTIKELRVDIEPIIEESALRDVHASPAFYRHDKLVQSEIDSELSSMGALSSTQMIVLIGAAVICTLLLAFVVNNRRRRAHAGFIEVDVCTPEERHLSGMQVTGYENPTYSFFDAKP